MNVQFVSLKLNYQKQNLGNFNFFKKINYFNLNYNKNVLDKLEFDDFKLEYREDFLEEMYDEKEYDIIFKCISYLFINNIPCYNHKQSIELFDNCQLSSTNILCKILRK